MSICRKFLPVVALVLLSLGGCVTAEDPGSRSGIRPLMKIERSGAPWVAAPVAQPVVFRVPQMKVIPVPQRAINVAYAPSTATRRPAAKLPPASADGELMMPLEDAVLSSSFGLRRHPILNIERAHSGIDLAAPAGTPVFAAASGTVEAVGPNGGYGNYVRLRHASGIATAYGHLSRFAPGIAPGATVEQGQVIAYVGSTGLSTGPHLHWEVLFRDEPIDPLRILGIDARVQLAQAPSRSSAAAAPGTGGR